MPCTLKSCRTYVFTIAFGLGLIAPQGLIAGEKPSAPDRVTVRMKIRNLDVKRFSDIPHPVVLPFWISDSYNPLDGGRVYPVEVVDDSLTEATFVVEPQAPCIISAGVFLKSCGVETGQIPEKSIGQGFAMGKLLLFNDGNENGTLDLGQGNSDEFLWGKPDKDWLAGKAHATLLFFQGEKCAHMMSEKRGVLCPGDTGASWVDMKAGFNICSGTKAAECTYDGMRSEDPAEFVPLLLVGKDLESQPEGIEEYSYW
jgi:hypothetical protein